MPEPATPTLDQCRAALARIAQALDLTDKTPSPRQTAKRAFQVFSALKHNRPAPALFVLPPVTTSYVATVIDDEDVWTVDECLNALSDIASWVGFDVEDGETWPPEQVADAVEAVLASAPGKAPPRTGTEFVEQFQGIVDPDGTGNYLICDLVLADVESVFSKLDGPFRRPWIESVNDHTLTITWTRRDDCFQMTFSGDGSVAIFDMPGTDIALGHYETDEIAELSDLMSAPPARACWQADPENADQAPCNDGLITAAALADHLIGAIKTRERTTKSLIGQCRLQARSETLDPEYEAFMLQVANRLDEQDRALRAVRLRLKGAKQTGYLNPDWDEVLDLVEAAVHDAQ